MIPKKIHYCWFGGNPLPEDVKRYIESWKKYCPDYELIRWDESNYDVHKNTYVELAYQNKKWAFLTDYARLDTIYEHGGIYLDADVELVHGFLGGFGFELVDDKRGGGIAAHHTGKAAVRFHHHLLAIHFLRDKSIL